MKHFAVCVLCLLCFASCQQAQRPGPQTEMTFTKIGKVKLQYGSALDDFRRVVEFDGGDIEDLYFDAKTTYETGKAKSIAAEHLIKRIDQSAQQVLSEWENDLDQYTDPVRKSDSANRLEAARLRHTQTMGKMRKAQALMQPVLAEMNDLVLYLRHRLNAIALGEVPASEQDLKRDIAKYQQAINQSIKEANEFIDEMD